MLAYLYPVMKAGNEVLFDNHSNDPTTSPREAEGATEVREAYP